MAQAPIHPSPSATVSSLFSLAEDVKHYVHSLLPPDARVLSTASARIYHSEFGARPDAWTYTGLRGMLVFGRNGTNLHPGRTVGVQQASNDLNYWFRLVDIDSGKGIVWFHPLPHTLDYRADKPFFHVFSGYSRMFGFRFDEDVEAETFLRRVTSRIQVTAPRMPKPRTASSRATPLGGAASSPTRSPTTRRVSPSMISAPAPGTFVHVSHVGVDADGQVEASANLDPAWTMVLDELRGYGVSEKMVDRDLDFVEGFLAGAKASLVRELEKTAVAAEAAAAAAPLARAPTGISRFSCAGGESVHAAEDVRHSPVASARKGRFMQKKAAVAA
ncbi:hypothetical protein OH77DRAFT_1435541 [Trametes cingulata]|nr:hypothetical protein OH77DRAFT_1435541 [Trametes cingulata]